MRQMINSMATKMEIGSPMASMYILGNPDHYKSHEYVNFSKQEDGTFIASSLVDDYRFRPLAYESLTLYEWIQSSEKKVRTRAEKNKFYEREELIRKLNSIQTDCGTSDDDGDYDGVSEGDDDSFIENNTSSDEEGSVNNDSDSDWCTDDDDADVVAKMKEKEKSYEKAQHDFLPAHKAAYQSHTVHCDVKKFDTMIPNFLGGALPRSDKGDREFYCMTMLTIFKPWRTPADLKDPESTWDQTFNEHCFSHRQKELIGNFNLRYECNDARDDHYALMRKKLTEKGERTGHPVLANNDIFENDFNDVDFGDEDKIYGEDMLLGRRSRRLLYYFDQFGTGCDP
ncbi:hypothetical protein K438DRAFT_1598224 [Mycena galopus ATCC 62051]|nr:hypothetical protein K438DRAFT_1598224 [Mycena galopus ATCC 62051]